MPAWIRRSLYALMLASCAIIGARTYLEFARTPVSPEPSNVDAAATPERLPDFTLNDVWGQQRSIGEWAGQPLLINFWATWCAPCRREMPLLQALHNERPVTGIQVIGIAIDRQPDVQAYITEAGISYPILSGESDAIAVSDLFGLSGLGLPFSVLADSDGNVLTVHIGELLPEQLRTMVEISRGVEADNLSVPDARMQLRLLDEP
jgi:thiol-disulfide isomerase/thioredoxin